MLRVSTKLPCENQLPHQIPRTLNASDELRTLLPSFRSADRMALMVVALGTDTSNGNAFSAATLTSNMRTASETDSPIAFRASAADSFTFSSTRT